MSLNIIFDSVSRQGEKVRPKEILVDTAAFEFGAHESKVDHLYKFIYSDEKDSQLVSHKNKYIKMQILGQFANKYTDKYFSRANTFHMAERIPSSFGPGFKNIEKLVSLDFADKDIGYNEEALILNSKFDRLYYEKQQLNITKKAAGLDNFYFYIFKDYLRNQLNYLDARDQNKVSLETPEPEKVKELLTLIRDIYFSDYRQLLAEFLQADVDEKKRNEDPESFPNFEEYGIAGLYEEFLEDKKINKKELSNFKAIIDIVNNSEDKDVWVSVAQMLLMFVDFFNRCISERRAMDLNQNINNMFGNRNEIGFEDSIVNPILLNTIEIQKILGESSKFLGTKMSDVIIHEELAAEGCECIYPDAYQRMHPDGPTLIRELNENEVVRPCPWGQRLADHIYELSTTEERESGEPNAYTLFPIVNLRIHGENLYYVLDQLKDLLDIEKFATEDRESIDLPFLYSLGLGELSSKELKTVITRSELSKKMNSLFSKIERIEEQQSEAKESMQDLSGDFLEAKKDVTQAENDLERLRQAGLEFGTEYTSISQNLSSLIARREQLLSFLEEFDEAEKKSQIEKKELISEYGKLEKEIVKLSTVDVDNSRKLLWIDDFLNTITTTYREEEIYPIALDCISTDIKYLNTGRNPLSDEDPGQFIDNLTVGKIGGKLSDLMYEEANTPIEPYLYPSIEGGFYSRGFEDLDWHSIPPTDETFSASFNKWVSYLEMEISKITSEMDGPRPRIKVTGKDNKERDVFEVGSGIGQVLPVIAICLLAKPGEVVCIEEPEAHLHPSAQAYIADFLLSMAASGRQIIIETHSPNIIDRLRLRKAHTKSWKKLVNYDWLVSELNLGNVSDINRKYSNFLKPEIKIIFAEQNEKGDSKYNEATIDTKGDIIFNLDKNEIWPEGFFDTAQEELSYILEARLLSLSEEE